MPVPKGTRIGGRQKGTPNKATADLKAIAKSMEPEATKRLAKLLRSENEAVALGAVREVYDRAFGKATTTIGNAEGEAFRTVTEIVLRGVRPDADDRRT